MAATIEAQLSECEMSIQTTRLEKEYERVLADSSRLLDNERDRVRRMEYLLLQFERDALRAQLDQAHEQLLESTRTERGARMQLEEAFQEIEHLDASLRTSYSEINKLRDELSSLNDTSTDYSDLLAEKQHLSRNLTNLQTELDRLRNQDGSYQTLISEKHDLERQLNSLEVQLEKEQNAHERTRAKGSQQAVEIDKLSARIEAMESELARELRAKQQSDHDTRQQNQGWESQRSVLEGKIETLKKQLRNAKDKLQEARQELQQRRTDPRIETETSEPRSKAVPLQGPGPESDRQSGVTIATPGAVRFHDKLSRKSALPGDKSVFSITPFLNRTRDVGDSPTSSDVDEQEVRKTKSDAKSLPRKTSLAEGYDSSEKHDAPARVLQSKAIKGKTTMQEEKQAKKATSKPTSKAASKISLEEDEEEDEPAVDQGQAKTKRRKLGAQRERSLFEEEEEEERELEFRKPGRKLGLGAGRSSILATSQLPGAARGFGAFSPLKRDRKRM